MSAGFCQFCGKPATSGARFCATCGKPMPGGESPVAAAAKGPPGDEKIVFELRPLAVRTIFELLLCLLTVGIAWIFLWAARSVGRRYVVTTQRIEMRRGLVTVRRSSLDLFRIEDYEVVEPFFLRTRGAGDLQIWSLDKSAPHLVLEAIPDVQNVYETMRTMTREERRKQGVRVIEGM